MATNYTYDTLNRIIGKSYTDTYSGNGVTPAVKYGYDGIALTGCAVTPPTLADNNPIGSRTAMCDGSGATSWSHDTMARVLNEKRLFPGPGSKSVSYTYNLDGSDATLVYPGSGKTIAYTYNDAGRPLSAKNLLDSVNTPRLLSMPHPES